MFFSDPHGIEDPKNEHTLVFVGGFLCWANPVLGFNYWGGKFDVIQDLNDTYPHTKAVEVFPGPISSNWDRACEVYAKLTGTKVDYGEAHAAKFGHDRFGRDYSADGPLVKGWDTTTKVHLIGHSQGGQTVRLLAELLRNGSADERNTTPAANLSPLFKSGQPGLVASVTTIATPNNGTTLAPLILNSNPLASLAVKNTIAEVIDLIPGSAFDFQLEAWGLKQTPGMSLKALLANLVSIKKFIASHDHAGWDLYPAGAFTLNTWVGEASGAYYFSWTTQKSHHLKNFPIVGSIFPLLNSNHEVPDSDINPGLLVFSTILGEYQPALANPFAINWFPNDGIVNTNSMPGPVDGRAIFQRNGSPSLVGLNPGVWNDMGLISGCDHGDVLGVTPSIVPVNVLSEYRNLARFLWSL